VQQLQTTTIPTYIIKKYGRGRALFFNVQSIEITIITSDTRHVSIATGDELNAALKR